MTTMRDDPRRRDLAAYPYHYEIQPRYRDMDANQHLNNISIAGYYEETRVRLQRLLVERNPGSASEVLRIAVAHVSIDYLAEGSYPEPLILGCGIRHLGTSSYRFGMALFQKGVCIGLSEAVLVHFGENGPAPLPAGLRTAFESALLRDPAEPSP